MNRKGFTLIELLVVIAIIALLMGILMPALNQARLMAQKLVCGTNLKGLGGACAVYAHDHDGDYPKAGGAGAAWSTNGILAAWDGGNRPGSYLERHDRAFQILRDASGEITQPGNATITSSWYMLIRHTKITPASFVCRGDNSVSEFKFKDYRTRIQDQADVFDFGGGAARAPGQVVPYPGEVVSYAYHMPYSDGITTFAISDVSGPDTPVAADRNPYLDKNLTQADLDDGGGNSGNHRLKGQNVLYKNLSVAFEKTPEVGMGGDNIYRFGADQICTENGTGAPVGQADAFLVHEKNIGQGG